MSKLVRALVITLVVLALALASVRLRFGGGDRLEDRTGPPSLPASALEEVAALDYPPGNVAVSRDGRVFLTLHPDGKPPVNVVELVDGEPAPYPDEAWQRESDERPYFHTVLSLRIDRQDRLWALDFADFGRGQPRLTAFDLATGELVHRHDFPRDVAGFASMLNDFQVSPDGKTIFIAETSPIVHRPALVVYDVDTQRSRRVLHRHPSLMPEPYLIQAPGRDMRVYGLIALRIGVDSIALDRDGEWLYYGPVNGATMYRIRARHLADASLSDEELAEHVEAYAPKTLSDGLTTDSENNVYLSDMEHSAVVRLGPDRKLTTLVKDERLRWPDGFSFGPDGWLYVTASALHHVLFVGRENVRAHAPYHVFRFRPGADAEPGH